MSHIPWVIQLHVTDWFNCFLRHVKPVPVLRLLTLGKLVTENDDRFDMVLVVRLKFPKMLVNFQFLFDSPKKLPMVIFNYGTWTFGTFIMVVMKFLFIQNIGILIDRDPNQFDFQYWYLYFWKTCQAIYWLVSLLIDMILRLLFSSLKN